MQTTMIPLPDLVTMGYPGNPKDHDIGAIVTSLQTFGFIDPVIVNQTTNHILSGHGRVHALVEMGERPEGIDAVGDVWLVPAHLVEVPEEQEGAAVIALNRTVELGGWDELALTKMLAEIAMQSDELLQATGYDAEELDAMLAGYASEPPEWSDEDLEGEDEPPFWAGDYLFPTNNDWEVPLLDVKRQAKALSLPLVKWGTVSRTSRMSGTWHYYTNDYKFEGLWKTPEKVITTGCAAIVEPNFSTNDQMPRAVSLWGIYRKRWLARYYQTCGIDIWVDLTVDRKFREDNLLGVPDGWKAFCTRAYSHQVDYLDEEYDIALQISGGDPLFLVYGGNSGVKDHAQSRGWLWVPEDADLKMGSGRFEDGA